MAEIRIAPAPEFQSLTDIQVLIKVMIRLLFHLFNPSRKDLRLCLELDEHIKQGSEYREQEDRDQPGHLKARILLFIQDMDREDRADHSKGTISPCLVSLVQPHIDPVQHCQLQRDK